MFRNLVAGDYDTDTMGCYSMSPASEWRNFRGLRFLTRDERMAASLSRDGRLLITAWNSLIGIKELPGGAEPRVFWPPEVPYSIALSPDAETLAVGLRTGGVALLDLPSGQWRATLRGQADTESIYCVRFSPDGTVLAASGVDHVIRLWDPASCKQIKTLVGNRAEVIALAFSPDGRTLADTSDEQAVRLWRFASGRELLVLEGPSKVVNLAFSPDGMTLAAGTWAPGELPFTSCAASPRQRQPRTSSRNREGRNRIKVAFRSAKERPFAGRKATRKRAGEAQAGRLHLPGRHRLGGSVGTAGSTSSS